MGVETKKIHVVRELLEHKDSLRLTEESNGGQTPLESAHKLRLTDIQRALMDCDPVHWYMEELYRDRQVYVDAANAILVGAALIASVTFVSWLQPPLGYAAGFVHVEHNRGLKAFWVANSLSFYAAIATVVFGARSVLPRRKFFIKACGGEASSQSAGDHHSSGIFCVLCDCRVCHHGEYCVDTHA